MKKSYFSQHRIIVLVLFLSLIILYSCRKESVPNAATSISPTNTEDAKLIAGAKTYFEGSALKTDSVKANALNAYKTPIQLLTKTINWDSAYTQITSIGKIVLLPVHYKENNFIKVGVYELPVSSLTRLFIYKNKKGVMCTEVVTRIPDTTYLNNSSKYKPFSGIINVWDWQGNFIKGFSIKPDGSQKSLGAPEYKPNSSNIQAMKLKTNDYTCTTYSWGTCGSADGGNTWYCHEDGSYTECSSGGGGGNTGNGGNINEAESVYLEGGGSASGNSGSTVSDADIANSTYVDDGKTPIDPSKYINCFTDGKTASQYKMTLYVDQPLQGSNNQISMTSYSGEQYTTPQGVLYNVGHAFVGFQKINTDGTSVTQVMGFYPGTHTLFPIGAIKDDGGHGYSVSYTTNVSASEFNSALNVLSNQNANVDYVLSNVDQNEFNCIDAALTWTLAGGITLPTSASRGVFKNSPGDYGQALRNVNGSNTTPGYAPISHGACN